MTTRSLFTALALLAAGTAVGAVAQERVQPKGPADFGALHADVKKQYDAGHYGKAYATANDLVGLIGTRRSQAIREALPAAPEGYEKVPFKEPKNQAMQNQMLRGIGMGNIIEQTYRGPGGQIKVTATADSPLIQMFQMVLNNPAMLGENQELIKYGELMALLEAQGNRKTLKIVIGNSMVESVFNGHDDDFIFAMWNQAAVDKVERAVSN